MRATILLVTCLAFGTLSPGANAQPAAASAESPRTPVARADLHLGVGWTNLRRSNLSTYDQWEHDIGHLAIGGGWYWTDHLKTEVELSADSRADFYDVVELRVGGQTAYQPVQVHVATKAVTVSQVFQAFRNAWAHPYGGVGVRIAREAVDEERDPLILYDATRGPVMIQPAETLPTRTSTVVRGVVFAGLKAYLSERAFFRSDLVVDVSGSEARRVVARAGFGVDF